MLTNLRYMYLSRNLLNGLVPISLCLSLTTVSVDGNVLNSCASISRIVSVPGYIPATATRAPEVFADSFTDITLLKVNFMGGAPVNVEAPPTAVYPLAGSPGVYIVALYDGGYTKMVQVTLTISSGAVYYAATGARYVSGSPSIASAAQLTAVWSSGTSIDIATCLTCNGYGVRGLTLSSGISRLLHRILYTKSRATILLVYLYFCIYDLFVYIVFIFSLFSSSLFSTNFCDLFLAPYNLALFISF